MTKSYNILFAPLQGYTDYEYRNRHSAVFGGIDEYFSPFIRMQPDGTIKNKDKKDIDPQLNTIVNFTPQILGGKEKTTRQLMEYVVSKGYKKVDINMGCSFPAIANRSQGAGLLKAENRALFTELMEMISDYPDIEVSLKMRLGWDNMEDTQALLPVINAAGLKSVTVHARYGVQNDKAECDLAGFGKFYEECEHDLYYNGDINSVADFYNITERFPNIAGVMIGRGLLANPFLGDDIRKRDSHDTAADKRAGKLKLFHDGLYESYIQKLQGEHQILKKMQTLWEYFLPDTDRKLLKMIRKSNRLSAYNEAVKMIFKSL